jgi:hypothetical protein
MRLDRPLSILALLVLPLLAGCTETEPTSFDTDEHSEWSAPANREGASQPWDTFYPLAIGNRWHSTRTWSGSWIGDGEPPWPAESGGEEYEFEQICTEVRGITYIVERQHWYDATGDSGTQHVRYRQNSSGLFEADVSLSEPPDCREPSVNSSAIERRPPYDRFWEMIATRISDPAARAVAKEPSQRSRGTGSARSSRPPDGFPHRRP